MGAHRAVKPAALADYLIESGDRVVTTERVAALLGVRAERVTRSLAVPRRDKRMLSVTKGLWAPVSAARRAAGTNPPVEYIDEMMTHLGHRYCLGYRSAAAMYGAAHFGWWDLQVITTARLRSRHLGAWPLVFVTRPDVDRLPQRTLSRAGAPVRVASPETTVFDLVARARPGARPLARRDPRRRVVDPRRSRRHGAGGRGAFTPRRGCAPRRDAP